MTLSFILPSITTLSALLVLGFLTGFAMSCIDVSTFRFSMLWNNETSGCNFLILRVWKDKVGPFMQLLHFAFGVGIQVLCLWPNSGPGAALAPMLVALFIGDKVCSSFFVYYTCVGGPRVERC